MSQSATEGNGRGRGGYTLVPFVFAAADREVLPSTVLVALLGDLGLSASAARTTLFRMRGRGFLEGQRRGRLVEYRLTGVSAAAFDRVRHADSPAAPWDGRFHGLLYTVPERQRSFRDALRRSAMLAGYGLLRPGLLISPYDRWSSIGATVDQCPDGARVLPVRLELGAAHARSAAAEAWPLDRLANAYRREARRLDTTLSRIAADPPATGATLRRYVRLLRPVIDTLIVDPGLPDALLPNPWPRWDALRGLEAVSDRFQPAMERYVATLLAN